MSYPHYRKGLRAKRYFRPNWDRIFDSHRYENYQDTKERKDWQAKHPDPRPMLDGDLYT